MLLMPWQGCGSSVLWESKVLPKQVKVVYHAGLIVSLVAVSLHRCSCLAAVLVGVTGWALVVVEKDNPLVVLGWTSEDAIDYKQVRN